MGTRHRRAVVVCLTLSSLALGACSRSGVMLSALDGGAGSCFEQLVDPQTPSRPAGLMPRDCDESHTHEVVFVQDGADGVDPLGVGPPGSLNYDSACAKQFIVYTGKPRTDSGYLVRAVWGPGARGAPDETWGCVASPERGGTSTGTLRDRWR